MSRTAEETFLYLQGQLDYMTASEPYSRSELISVNVRKQHRYKSPSAGTSVIPFQLPSVYKPPLCPVIS